jgi:RNA polymerase sigma factor (sigma-70 family)
MQASAGDERSLVERARQGDALAQREFVERYHRLVAHVVHGMVDDFADREDLCQEAFLRAIRGLSSFRFQSRLSTWVATVAYNACASFYARRAVRRAAGFESGDSDSGAAAEGELPPASTSLNEEDRVIGALSRQQVAECLHDEIRRLPAHYRTTIALFHLDGLSHHEIATAMGVSVENVKIRLYRGRAALRRRLGARFRTEDLCV